MFNETAVYMTSSLSNEFSFAVKRDLVHFAIVIRRSVSRWWNSIGNCKYLRSPHMANESSDKRLELFLLLHIVLLVSKQTNSEHNCFLISTFFSISQFPDHAQKNLVEQVAFHMSLELQLCQQRLRHRQCARRRRAVHSEKKGRKTNGKGI